MITCVKFNEYLKRYSSASSCMHNARIDLFDELSLCLQSHLITKQLHGLLIGAGLSHDPYFATRIVRFYGLNGDVFSARQVFDQCPHRSIFLWNSMIRAYARSHEFILAFSLFCELAGSDTRPDQFTFTCLLRACSETCDLARAKWIHGMMVVSGLSSGARSGTALLNAYSRFGLIDDADRIFRGIENPDLISWNSLFSAYSRDGFWVNVLRLFCKMQSSGTHPDECTIVELISCIYKPQLHSHGTALHGLSLKYGLNTSVHVGSAIVNMYSRCCVVASAHQMFVEFPEPDMIMWSSLITGCSQSGAGQQALLIFSEMMDAGRTPDAIILASVLAACGRAAIIRCGKEIHCCMLRGFHEPDTMVASALVDFYFKCGFISLALRVFEMMKERNRITYNAVLQGLGAHGCGELAVEVFKRMLEEGFKPDKSTFSAILFACCHAGLVVEGRILFKRMEEEFGMVPETEHYVYMVKLLGMGAKLEEAYKLVLTMPHSPDSGVWGALLLGYIIHGDSEPSEAVARLLSEMKPEKMTYRIMLSNVYAANERWNDAQNVREAITRSGKTPGFSCVV